MNPFGERLAQLRKRAGISQYRLAQATALDASYISRLEKGERGPSRDRARMLSRELGDSSESLLIAAGYMPSWLSQAVDQGHLELVTYSLGDLRAITQRDPKKLMWRINLLTEELARLAGGHDGQGKTAQRKPAPGRATDHTAHPAANGRPGRGGTGSVDPAQRDDRAAANVQHRAAAGADRGAA